MKKLKSQETARITCPILLQSIVTALFPQHQNEADMAAPLIESWPPITSTEVTSASKRIGVRKAPGPDGIPNKALKLAVTTRPEVFVDTFNVCLRDGVFPKRWKLQRLILLPKGGKPIEEPSGYRPICLLDTAGKILERIIYNRLLRILEDEGTISDSQFGFRKSRSTLPPGCKLFGFADDLALVVVAKEVQQVEGAANEAIRRISGWMETAGLALASHKTEAVLITSRVERLHVSVGDSKIRSKESIKYLGVFIDNRLSFRAHLE
ncbi:hypothetical protein KR044_005573, partial [Drosophila immigrans]